MQRDYSNIRCNNCREYGHIKRTCPGLRTFNIGVITVCNEEINKPSTPHNKTQKPSILKKNQVSNSSRVIGHLGGSSIIWPGDKPFTSVNTGGLDSNINGKNSNINKPSAPHNKTQKPSILKKNEVSNSSRVIGHLGGSSIIWPEDKPSTSVSTGGLNSNINGKKNSTFGNQNQDNRYSVDEKDSDSDDDSFNSNYCSICDTNEHDDMECLQEEMMAFIHTCYYCDETGHFEDKCPSFLKAEKEQDDYDKKWRQKWGKKILKNKKVLQSMAKPPGMHCQYCYSIHHTTELCFLSPYGVKEDLKI